MLVSPKRYGHEGPALELVTWADGTDEQIVAMVAAADNGDIDLTDYWSVGNERSVTLSAMSNTDGTITVGETHAAQTVTLVIMNEGYSVNGVDNSHIHFVVGLKNSLNEKGYMNNNNTNSTGWRDSARRGWCNSIFYASFPDTLRPIFKLFNTKTASTGNNSNASIDTLQDRFALFAEKEVFGSKTQCAGTEAAQLNRINYYTTSSNRIKQVSGSNSNWWERSPRCYDTNCIGCVYISGTATSDYANNLNGLAPFGCI